jgi:apolipoprotein N-acyltransferase
MKNNLFVFGFFLFLFGMIFFWMDYNIDSLLWFDNIYSFVWMLCFFFGSVSLVLFCVFNEQEDRKNEIVDSAYHKWVDTHN